MKKKKVFKLRDIFIWTFAHIDIEILDPDMSIYQECTVLKDGLR